MICIFRNKRPSSIHKQHDAQCLPSKCKLLLADNQNSPRRNVYSLRKTCMRLHWNVKIQSVPSRIKHSRYKMCVKKNGVNSLRQKHNFFLHYKRSAFYRNHIHHVSEDKHRELKGYVNDRVNVSYSNSYCIRLYITITYN